MRVILHQAFKDARMLRGILAAWVLVLLAFHAVVIYAVHASALDSRTLSRMSVVEMAFAVLGTTAFIVIAGMLVQSDSPSSTTAFWLTRAMSAHAMLASKLLFAFVVLVAFPILLDAIDFVVAGVDVRWLPLSVPFQLAWMLPLMAVAAITLGLSQLLLVTLFEVVLFIGVFAGAAALKIPVPLRFVDVIVASWMLAALSAALLVFVYLTRWIRSSAVLFGIAPALLLALIAVWPWQEVSGPLYPEARRRSISVALKRESLQSVNRSTTHVIYAPLTITGVPAGTMLYVAAPRGWLQVGGERLALDIQPFGVSSSPRPAPFVEGLAEEAIRLMSPALAGTRLLNPNKVTLSHPAISIYISEADFDRVANRTGVLHTEFDLVAYEWQVAAKLPARPGVSFDTPALHTNVLKVQAGTNDATIAVREASVAWYTLAWSSHICLLRNPGLQQSVIGSWRNYASFSEYNIARHVLPVPQSLVLQWRTVIFDLRTPDSAPPADWLKNAELVVVSRERAGKIPVTIDIPGIRLSQIPPM